MPTDTSVKFLSSAMTGAPVLSGANAGGAGGAALLAVLQACLVDGWGLAPVDSIVVTSGVAKVTRAAGHPFVDGQVALISGSTPVALNGEKRVTVLSPTQYTFEASGVPDGTATGTISHKVAPLGWANPFAAAGSVGVFKSTDPAASGCVLRVDDSGTVSARVVGYEQMVDLDNGNGGAPALAGQKFPANIAGGAHWTKSNAADATARAWWLFGDGRAFYLCAAYSGGAAFTAYYFGDFQSARTGSLDCMLFGTGASAASNATGANAWELDSSDGMYVSNVYFPRSYTNLGGPPTEGYRCAPVFSQGAAAQRSGAAGMMPFPNPTDGGIYVSPMYLSEPTKAMRGTLPGFYFLLNSVGTALPNGSRFQGVVNLPGRQLLTLNSASGAFAFDITGPWR